MTIAARYADLFQMSYITRDLDAAIEHCRRELGFEHMATSDSEVEVLYRGEPRKLVIRAAFGNVGTRQLELIQPVSGPVEVYTDEVDLDAHIINYHHIAIAVRGDHGEWLKLLDEVRASGDEFAYLFPAEPSGEDKVCFCYVDTRKRIGHYTEYLWIDEAIRPMMAAIPEGM
ncbi:MAG TPA: VOC family protein [Novosphingobium sp.]|nr:VOC family protein [Novosphingobium sp.]